MHGMLGTMWRSVKLASSAVTRICTRAISQLTTCHANVDFGDKYNEWCALTLAAEVAAAAQELSLVAAALPAPLMKKKRAAPRSTRRQSG